MTQADEKGFFDRADAHITLANEQLSDSVDAIDVNNSLMYSSARYNAWVAAFNCKTGKQLAASRSKTIDMVVAQYRAMMEENIDDYIENFDDYMLSE